MTEPITVASASVTGGVGQNIVKYNLSVPNCASVLGINYLNLDSVEIWASETDDRQSASLAGEMSAWPSGEFSHDGLGEEATWYYWIRPRNNAGDTGGDDLWYPSGNGLSATTRTIEPPDGSIGIGKFAPGITPIEIVSSLPASGNYEGRVVFYGGQLYRHTGSPAGADGFTVQVPAVNIDGVLTSDQIESIVAEKISGTITETQISDGAVLAPHISVNELSAISANLGEVTTGTLTAGVSYLGTVTADQVDVNSLSAISANLGTVTAGTLSANVAYLGSVSAAQISTNSLSAISANLGTVTAGTIRANVSYQGTVNANQVNATNLSAISANLGTITAGSVTGITFTGGVFRTSASGRRVEIRGNTNRLETYGPTGSLTSSIGGGGAGDSSHMLFIGGESHFAGRLHVLSASFEGVFARSIGSAIAIRGMSDTVNGGEGIIGAPTSRGGWAFYADRGDYGPFTGAHPGLLLHKDEAIAGDILVDVKVLARDGISNTLTEVALCDEEMSRAIIGVLGSRRPLQDDALLSVKLGPAIRNHFVSKYDYATINGVGEGQVNVCGKGGNISKGDLICASDMPGKGQRQNDEDGEPDDFVRRHTVARAREDVTFSAPGEWRRVSCIYLAG